jgi:hypothetical protein
MSFGANGIGHAKSILRAFPVISREICAHTNLS